MRRTSKKLTYVNVGLLPEEFRTLKSIQRKYKRKTPTDTVRFLILNDGEKILPKDLAVTISSIQS